jgi:hypothetical protein
MFDAGDAGDHLGGRGRVGLGQRKLVQDLEILDAADEAVVKGYVVVEAGELGEKGARAILVVPEAGAGGLLAKLGCAGALAFDVKDRP